jgi:hypothetical protein
VQRRGQVVAAQPGRADAGLPDGDVEPVLQVGPVGDTQPVEQRPVRRVDVELAPAERVRQAAEPRLGLEQRYPPAGVGQPQSGGDAGEPAADHRDVGARHETPAIARTATVAFSQPDSDSRRS